MTDAPAAQLSLGSSEMAQRIRAHDWPASSLGAMESWPVQLRTTLATALQLPQPASVCWGRDARIFYNDGYRTILGDKHPDALGLPLTEVWPELAEALDPAIDAVLSGVPQHWEDVPFAIAGRGEGLTTAWFSASWSPIHLDDGSVGGFLMVAIESTLEHLGRQRLRETEERQAFLLTLSDALSPLTDPEAMVATACRVLGEYLGACRVAFSEIDEETGRANIREEWSANGASPYPAMVELADFDGPLLTDLRAGRTVRLDDVGEPPFARPDLAAFAAMGVKAGISVPLRVGGRFVGNFNVRQEQPRTWSDAEVALVEDVAARLWHAVERGRAEQALKRSEARFRGFVTATADAVYRMSADWSHMRWLHGQTFLPDINEPSMYWMDDYIPVEDRTEMQRAIDEAIAGGSIFTLEHRIRRADGSIGWAASRAVPIKDEKDRIVEWIGAASDITDAKAAEEYQRTLLAELQHRVRNLLAVIRSIITRTAIEEQSAEEYVDHLQGRISALARTQTLLTRAANAGIQVETLVREELLAEAIDQDQVTLSGPEIMLSPKASEVLGLALHELTTNAIKYGALSRRKASLRIDWQVEVRGDQPWLVFNWVESGVPVLGAAPMRVGFGTELITRRIPYELRGSGTLKLQPGGAICRIEFPIMPGSSILETDGVAA